MWPWPTWTATPTGCSATTAARFTDVAEAAGVAWGGRRAARSRQRHRARVRRRHGQRRPPRPAGRQLRPARLLRAIAAAAASRTAPRRRGLAVDSRYDACAPADIDHDGRLDLYVNGTVTGGASWQDFVFRNTGAGFVDVTPANLRALQADHGVQWADVDGDGDLDLALTGSARRRHAPGDAQPAGRAGRRQRRRRSARSTPPGTRHWRAPRCACSRPARRGCSARAWSTPVPATTRRATCRCTSGSRSGIARVDVQLTVPRGGTRHVTWKRGVDVRASAGRAVELRARP